MFESQVLNYLCLASSFIIGWVFRMAYVRSRGRLSLQERELIEKEVEDLLAQARAMDAKALSFIEEGKGSILNIKYLRLMNDSKTLKNEAKKKLANMRLYDAS